MRIKFHAFCLLILVAIAAISLFLFARKELYRVDCGKNVKGYELMFVYLRSCPHCYNDLLRIRELNLTERVYMVDAGDASCSQIINEYSDYVIYHKNSNLPNLPAGIYVPTKICLRNNLTYVGEMLTDELREFFERCVGG